MADQARLLLQAIDNRLKEQTTEGQVLANLQQYYVRSTGEDVPPDFGNAMPCALVTMGIITGEMASFPPCMTDKLAPVRFQVFTGKGSEQHDQTAAELIDLVEDVFFQQQLGIPQLRVNFISKEYVAPLDPELPFQEWVQGSASLDYQYGYTDTRPVPQGG